MRISAGFLWMLCRKNREDNMSTLKDKVAIVIGASKGIGVGIAKVFVEKGAKVVIAARNKALLEKVQKEIFEEMGAQVEIFVADITKRNEIDSLIEFTLNTFGRLDILSQNAGVFPSKPLLEMTDQDWDYVLDTNLKGTFHAVSACLPVMKKQGYGRIVVTSSITGTRTGNPSLAHYSASKAGINGFVKTAAIELAPYNITINCVEPGNIITEALRNLGDDYIKAQSLAVPLGFLGEPKDIGYAAAYLVSDEARYVTGQSIIVDGGQTLPESHYDIPRLEK
jgi:3-oxoacyl-[acyl-carrier protein] reductase